MVINVDGFVYELKNALQFNQFNGPTTQRGNAIYTIYCLLLFLLLLMIINIIDRKLPKDFERTAGESSRMSLGKFDGVKKGQLAMSSRRRDVAQVNRRRRWQQYRRPPSLESTSPTRRDASSRRVGRGEEDRDKRTTTREKKVGKEGRRSGVRGLIGAAIASVPLCVP